MSIDLSKSKNYGEYIKNKRLHLFNMSQEEFAEKLDVPVGTLRNWEQNLSQPPSYFMQLLDMAERMLIEKHEPPITKIRNQTILENQSDNELQAIRREARKKINNDETQSRIYEYIKKATDPNGIIENLQITSSYFNDYNTTDIATIAQVILLKDINEKLDTLIELQRQS